MSTSTSDVTLTALATRIGLVYMLLERRGRAIFMAHDAQTMAAVGLEKAA